MLTANSILNTSHPVQQIIVFTGLQRIVSPTRPPYSVAVTVEPVTVALQD